VLGVLVSSTPPGSVSRFGQRAGSSPLDRRHRAFGRQGTTALHAGLEAPQEVPPSKAFLMTRPGPRALRSATANSQGMKVSAYVVRWPVTCGVVVGKRVVETVGSTPESW
jgi:hypothetical protein